MARKAFKKATKTVAKGTVTSGTKSTKVAKGSGITINGKKLATKKGGKSGTRGAAGNPGGGG